MKRGPFRFFRLFVLYVNYLGSKFGEYVLINKHISQARLPGACVLVKRSRYCPLPLPRRGGDVAGFVTPACWRPWALSPFRASLFAQNIACLSHPGPHFDGVEAVPCQDQVDKGILQKIVQVGLVTGAGKTASW